MTLPAGDRPRRLHRDRVRAGLLHEPRQGRGLQAHPGLLPASTSGAVGGVVGLIGGLGGFVLPIAVRRAQRSHRRLARAASWLLFAALRAGAGLDAPRDPQPWRSGVDGEELKKLPELPEMQEIHRAQARRRASGPQLIEDWRPEDKEFWEQTGRAHRAAQPAGSRSRRCCSRSPCGWCGRWSSPSCRAIGFTYTHRPAVLARGPARALGRDAAHLLLLHGADLRRPAVDHARPPGR